MFLSCSSASFSLYNCFLAWLAQESTRTQISLWSAVGWLQCQKGMAEQRCLVHGVQKAEQGKSARLEMDQWPYQYQKLRLHGPPGIPRSEVHQGGSQSQSVYTLPWLLYTTMPTCLADSCPPPPTQQGQPSSHCVRTARQKWDRSGITLPVMPAVHVTATRARPRVNVWHQSASSVLWSHCQAAIASPEASTLATSAGAVTACYYCFTVAGFP